MSLRRSWLLSLVGLVACGGDTVSVLDAPPLEPLCGEDGPVELLRLADDEAVGWVDRIGDRDDVHVIVVDAEPSAPDELPLRRRNVVVDGCGEAAMDLPADPDYLTWWGDVLIGCVDRDLVVLQGYDDPSPQVVARRGCAARLVGDRWVAFDVDDAEAETGRLVALEDDAGDGVTVHALLDEVLTGDPGRFPSVANDRVFVQTPELAIVSVDPRTFDTTLEVEPAERWAWAPRGDAIAYRPPGLDGEETGPVIVRDRRTGAEQTLDAEVPRSWWVGWEADGVLTVAPMGPPVGQRWFRLDPLREILAPEGTTIERVRADGLVWLARSDGETRTFELLRWREDEAPQPAWSCTYCGADSQRHLDSIDVVVQTPHPDRIELWRLDDAVGPARRLADGIDRGYTELHDGRLLAVDTPSGTEHGPLSLFDGADGPAVSLAPRVSRNSTFFTVVYDTPDELVYEATPADGPHALYRARLAPP